MTALRTARLLLRPWTAADREPFAALNADPVVMEHFPQPLDRAASDALADRAQAGIDARGWGLWALEVDGLFAGFVGLSEARPELPFPPAPEVGWRLARWAWGRRLATEAAAAAVRHARGLGVGEVVSFTAVTNLRSEAVMRRLGMTREAVFEHPALPPGHPLRPHVLYRLPADRPPADPPPG